LLVNSKPVAPVEYPEEVATADVETRVWPSTIAPSHIPASNRCSVPEFLGYSILGVPVGIRLMLGLPIVPTLVKEIPRLLTSTATRSKTCCALTWVDKRMRPKTANPHRMDIIIYIYC